MLGLDTNVVVRLLTNDDAGQSSAARAHLDANCSGESPAFVSREVVLETVWVLENVYGHARADVASAIEGLLQAGELAVEGNELVREAVRNYRSGADFADALIAAVNAAVGCDATATFDKAAASRSPHFTLLRVR